MKTAFITGATTGIGYELVKRFAQDGFALFLVARNEARLQEIQQSLNVPVTYLSADLSDAAAVHRVLEYVEANGIAPECVVNCAGYGATGDYAHTEWSALQNMLTLNAATVAQLTHHFAKQMVERRSGKIMNVASTASFTPLPYMAMYGATKAFVLSLSEALAHELRGTGVTITALCPGVTDTNFFKRDGITQSLLKDKFLAVSTPQEVARYGYAAMMRGDVIAMPGWRNRLNIFLARFVSRKMLCKIAANTTTH